MSKGKEKFADTEPATDKAVTLHFIAEGTFTISRLFLSPCSFVFIPFF